MVEPEVTLWTSMKGMVLRWVQNKLWGDNPLKLCEAQLYICQTCQRIGSTIAVKISELSGNAGTFLPISFAGVLDFAVAI